MKMKLEEWEKIRTKGKWHYILTYGVLLWGVSTAILFSLLTTFVMGEQASFLITLPLSIVLFPLGGIAWGYFMWIFSEKAYKKSKISEQTHAADAYKPCR
jgi:hypothetical protein